MLTAEPPPPTTHERLLDYLKTLSKKDQVENKQTCSTFKLRVGDTQHKLPVIYWIPTLHKKRYQARFIANSSACTTVNISILLTSCLTAIKEHVRKYCDKAYGNSGIDLFWSIKNSGDILAHTFTLRCRDLI